MKLRRENQVPRTKFQGRLEVRFLKFGSWILVLGISWFMVVALTGCGHKEEKSSAKVYDIKGKIMAIRPDKEGVTLDHEDIPGLMKGMKMEFLVEDARILEGLQVGDQVQGKLKVESGSQMITELKKR